MKRTIFIYLLPFLFLGLLPSPAFAEDISLKVSPNVFQIDALAPADIQAPFTIENQSNASVTLKVFLKSFSASDIATGRIHYTYASLTNANAFDEPFLKQVQVTDNAFAIDSVVLAPKQVKKLDLRVFIPKKEPLADHYFSIIFLSFPTQNDDETTNIREGSSFSTIQAAISLPVLLAIGPKNPNYAFLDDFSAPLFLQSGPVPFNIDIRNASNHYIRPKGKILITNLFGQTVGSIDIPTTNILARTSRLLSVSNDKTDEQTQGKVVWNEKFLLGFYTATISLAISPQGPLYTRTIHFAAFPLSFLIGVFVIILLIGLIIFKIKRRLAQE